MSIRTYLAVIALMFPIMVAEAKAAPEDRTDYRLDSSDYQVKYARHYYRHASHVVRHREPVIQVAVDSELLRARGRELIARMKKDLGSNPTHWPSVWCGRYVSMVTGRNGKRSVNLASDWAHEGSPAPRFAIGSVAVSMGHVAVVAPGGNCPSGTFNTISGNSVGRLVSYMCAQRSSYFSFRWVSVANSQVHAIPLPKARPEFPPMPTPNPEPKIYESSLPPQTQSIGYDAFDTYIFPPIEEPAKPSPTFVRTGPFVMSVRPETMKPGDMDKIIERDEISSYLCDVYKRERTKVDGSGDFTWKDIAAAKRMKMEVCQYVIGGMARSAQKAFYKIGKLLDGKGVRWTILSGFRDDYRQRIAEGFKACNSCSLHGGSRFGGYGNGQAMDVSIVGDVEDGPKRAGDIFAKYAHQFGISRPMPGIDPAHLQLVDRVAHLKPWKWFAVAEKPKLLPAAEAAVVSFDIPIPKVEKPVQTVSLGKDIPLTKHQRLFQMIREEASKNGLDGDTLVEFAYLENNDFEGGSMGVFGVTAPERRRLKQRDNSLPEQIRVGVAHLLEDYKGLIVALKRHPTANELYYSHFLGIGAGLAVIRAPNDRNLREAIDEGEKGLGAKALAANPGLRKLTTVGAFKKSIEERLKEARGVIRA